MTGLPPGPAVSRRPPIHAPRPDRMGLSRAHARRRLIGRWIAASLLLHAALLLGWLLPDMTRKLPEPLPPAAIEVVMEGGAPDRPAQQPAEAAPPPAEAPAVPDAPPPVPAPPPPPAPPVAQPAAPAPPPPPVEAPPTPAPPRPAPAAVPEPPPPADAPAPPEPPPVPQPPVPQPPLPEPPLPEPPPPETQAPPEPEPPSFSLPTPRPLALPIRPRAPAPPAPAPRSSRNAPIWLPEGFAFERPSAPTTRRRQLDTAIGPDLLGRLSPDPTLEVRGAQVGPDWRNAFRAWLDQNLRYPELARLNGEDGTVQVRITASPDGTVRGVRLLRGSGSTWLDRGTQVPFRAGARLPPFPPGADPSGVTIDLQVVYTLIRR
ncbi:TonB family protein [Humitalea rosea]|uniref:TonB family protein n=1 Tax=Humitalea rosea TaxID=990373 RepID=A0A2W7I9N5_9PROT|nr:energy transducer TonB [Humitalea rosea]PZW43616.1 TonB family protein [Humitalea rosea]